MNNKYSLNSEIAKKDDILPEIALLLLNISFLATVLFITL
jgi:hypothetical protein